MTKTEKMRAILDACSDIAPGMTFRHTGGGLYRVHLISIDSNTKTARVVFDRVDGPNFDAVAERGIYYDRPIEEWCEPAYVRED